MQEAPLPPHQKLPPKTFAMGLGPTWRCQIHQWTESPQCLSLYPNSDASIELPGRLCTRSGGKIQRPKELGRALRRLDLDLPLLNFWGNGSTHLRWQWPSLLSPSRWRVCPNWPFLGNRHDHFTPPSFLIHKYVDGYFPDNNFLTPLSIQLECYDTIDFYFYFMISAIQFSFCLILFLSKTSKSKK